MATPELVERAPQPFAGIHAEIKPDQLAGLIDKSFRTLFGWLAQRGIRPTGAPFIKYNVIDMQELLDVDLGIPIATPIQSSGEVLAGTVPGGRYAVVIHQGHYNGLREATGALLQSAQTLGVTWDSAPTPRGERFASRLETYTTDPSKEPDSTRWQTEIAIKTR